MKNNIIALIVLFFAFSCQKTETGKHTKAPAEHQIMPLKVFENIDGTNIFLFFDTGCTISSMDSSFYEQYIPKTKPFDTIQIARPDNKTLVHVPIFNPPRLFRPIVTDKVADYNLFNYRKSLPVIDMIVGGDYFKGRALHFNASAGTIKLYSGKEASGLQFDDSLRIVVHNNIPYLYAELFVDEQNSFEGMYLIDTGFSGTINLWPHALDEYGIVVSKRRHYHSKRLNSNLLGDTEGELFQLDSISLSNTTIENPRIFHGYTSDSDAIYNKNFVGLIGYGLLSRLNFMIDYKKKYIYFSKAYPKISNKGFTAGLAPGKALAEGLLIQGMIYDSPADSADIRIGDILLEADGLEANRKNYLTIIKRLITPGTVTLKLKRNDSIFIKKVPVRKLL